MIDNRITTGFIICCMFIMTMFFMGILIGRVSVNIDYEFCRNQAQIRFLSNYSCMLPHDDVVEGRYIESECDELRR